MQDFQVQQVILSITLENKLKLVIRTLVLIILVLSKQNSVEYFMRLADSVALARKDCRA